MTKSHIFVIITSSLSFSSLEFKLLHAFVRAFWEGSVLVFVSVCLSILF